MTITETGLVKPRFFSLPQRTVRDVEESMPSYAALPADAHLFAGHRINTKLLRYPITTTFLIPVATEGLDEPVQIHMRGLVTVHEHEGQQRVLFSPAEQFSQTGEQEVTALERIEEDVTYAARVRRGPWGFFARDEEQHATRETFRKIDGILVTQRTTKGITYLFRPGQIPEDVTQQEALEQEVLEQEIAPVEAVEHEQPQPEPEVFEQLTMRGFGKPIAQPIEEERNHPQFWGYAGESRLADATPLRVAFDQHHVLQPVSPSFAETIFAPGSTLPILRRLARAYGPFILRTVQNQDGTKQPVTVYLDCQPAIPGQSERAIFTLLQPGDIYQTSLWTQLK